MPKGDFTRDTFHREKHYRSVRMQQGRVQLDADWNEAEDIQSHLRETGVRDIVGPCGAPREGGGFRVEVAAARNEAAVVSSFQTTDVTSTLRQIGDGHIEPISLPDGAATLVLSPGRLYVDGILCELEPAPEVAVASEPLSDVISASIHEMRASGLQKGDWVEVVTDLAQSGAAGWHARIEEVLPHTAVTDRQTLRLNGLSAAIVSFLSAWNPRLRRAVTYTSQPDFPGATLPGDDGTYLAYLHVWQRHLSWLDDPRIRETALGGPDTATRVKTVWQVDLLRLGAATDRDDQGNPFNCLSTTEKWRNLTAPSTGRLRARTQPQTVSKDPCIVPESAGFTGLENQFYRVEIHTAGDRNHATFKWSRENGSVVAACAKQDGKLLTVGSAGRDAVLGIRKDDWVELIDDGHELRGEPGTMLQVVDVRDDVVEVASAVDLEDFPLNPKLRRWESAARAMTDLPSGGWFPLEHGIEVQLGEGTYRTGDYWLIPARAFIGPFAGDIEWPEESPGVPAAELPRGIAHHYCKLALVKREGGKLSVLSDCRPLFPTLTRLTRLVELCGNHQQALPGETLPYPLEVGVYNGDLPVAGARVRFTIENGGGTLQSPRGIAGGELPPFERAADGSSIVFTTLSSGVVACFWTLGPKIERQRVKAILLDAAGAEVGPEICFAALLIEPLIFVQEVFSLIDLDNPLENDSLITVGELASGLLVGCSGPLPKNPFARTDGDFRATSAKPTFAVALELPYPLGGEDSHWNVKAPFGFHSITLAGTAVPEGNAITWTPTLVVARSLGHLLSVLKDFTDRLLVRLTLEGSFIWQDGKPEVFLAGNAFGKAGPGGRVDLQLDNLENRRAGKFEMWFWMVEKKPEGPDLIVSIVGSTVFGAVRDSKKQPMQDEQVFITDVAGNSVGIDPVKTDPRGEFRFLNVPSGTFNVALGNEAFFRRIQVISTTRSSGQDEPRSEIPTLEQVQGLGPIMLERLRANGITTPAQLAALDLSRATEIMGVPEGRVRNVIENARKLQPS